MIDNEGIHFPDGLYVSERNPDHKIWYKNGKFHREDGPAFISPHGVMSPRTFKMINEHWYIDGELITSYEQLQELTGHSDAYITYLKLKWGEIQW